MRGVGGVGGDDHCCCVHIDGLMDQCCAAQHTVHPFLHILVSGQAASFCPCPGTCHNALPHLSVLPPPVRACRVPVFITPCCTTHVTYQVCSTHPADDCDAPTLPPYTRHVCLSTPMLHIPDMVYVGNTS